MKRQNFYSLALKASAVALLMSGVGLTANAQNLVNEAAGKIENTGTIKFKKTTGTLENDAPMSNHSLNSGTIEFEQGAAFTGDVIFGADAAKRIPGKVVYSQIAGGPQAVVAAFYDSLTLRGGSGKSIPDGVYISGTYMVDDLTGTRTYAGILHYDSYVSGGSFATASASPQIIYQETGNSGSNQYNSLALTGNAKALKQSLNGTDVVKLADAFTSDADATLYIAGKLELGTGLAVADGDVILDTVATSSITMGSGLATFNKNVNVNLGSFILPENSNAVIGATTGLLALANSEDAQLSLALGSELMVTGNYTNDFNTGLTAYTNATYDSLSTVLYNSAVANQIIVPSVETNKYGNLKTDAGTKFAGGNVYLANDLTVAGGNLDMTAGDAQDYELNMGLGEAIYGTTLAATTDEVRGKMIRTGTFATATDYRYNNLMTIIRYTDAGTGGLPTSVGFRVLGNTAPLNFVAGTDVKRKITPTFTGGGTDWASKIKAGYKEADEIDNAAWSGQAIPTLENSLRYIESQDQAIPNVEKVSTGTAYERDLNAAVMRWVSLEGIGPASTNVDGRADSLFKSGNDLVLRGGPVIFNAIASGRWSNPNTWDEGMEPTSTDYAVINGFTVHAGYIRATDNYATAEASPTDLARGIWVGSNDENIVPTLDNSGLVFGTINGEGGTVPSFSMTASAGAEVTRITNKGGATTPTTVNLAGLPDATANDINGLIIYAGSTLQSDNLTNEGRLGNAGDVEIGD